MSEVIPQTCLLCGAERHTTLKRFPNGVVVGRCSECGLMYTPMRLEHPEASFSTTPLEKLRAYHEPLVAGRLDNYRTPVFRRYLSDLAQYGGSPGKRLLDVGCAHGFFLDEARRAGYETVGIEPSPPAAAFAREELRLDVREGRLDQVDLGDLEFDVITMTDSLEYLPRPRDDLGEAVRHLAPGGLFFAKVPNGDYFVLRRLIESRRDTAADSAGAFSPPGRVAHYTSETLARLVDSVGLDVVRIGGFTPIDSPSWAKLTGLPLAVRPPKYMDLGPRVARRMLHGLGIVEQSVTRGRNHLSQSIGVIARRRGGT